MTLEEFMEYKPSDCSCGNKVKPAIQIEEDMSATLECPIIECGYCNKQSWAWPNDFDGCASKWEAMQ